MNTKMIMPVRVNPVLNHPGEQRISLDGQWRLRLDPEDKGLDERWYEQNGVFTNPITVPGCWQGQGYGDDSKDTVWDFNFQVQIFRTTFTKVRGGMLRYLRLLRFRLKFGQLILCSFILHIIICLFIGLK